MKMTLGHVTRIVCGTAFIFFLPLCSRAASGKPVTDYAITGIHRHMTDTIPAAQAAPAASAASADPAGKPVTTVIKKVPKARRQAVPVPVNVQVKPVITVKPKIIKPVIRVIH